VLPADAAWTTPQEWEALHLTPGPDDTPDTAWEVDTGETPIVRDVAGMPAWLDSPFWAELEPITDDRWDQLAAIWTMREPLLERVEARVHQTLRWWTPRPLAAVIEAGQ